MWISPGCASENPRARYASIADGLLLNMLDQAAGRI
jgi:hypothetical protein